MAVLVTSWGCRAHHGCGELFGAVYSGTRPGLSPAIRAGKGWRRRRELAPRCSATQLAACRHDPGQTRRVLNHLNHTHHAHTTDTTHHTLHTNTSTNTTHDETAQHTTTPKHKTHIPHTLSAHTLPHTPTLTPTPHTHQQTHTTHHTARTHHHHNTHMTHTNAWTRAPRSTDHDPALDENLDHL